MSTCCEPRRWRAAGDDALVQAEALRGLNAGGGAGNAEAQLVVGNECDFIDAGGGVEHARSVGGVDLERGVMGGDERPRACFEEIAGDGDGERGAFFRIGGRAEFIEQDEGAARRQVARGGSRLTMCAENVESSASMDWASPMSARNAVKIGKLAAAAGTGRPACAIMASSAVVLRVTVLPPVLGPLMMSWRASAVSSSVSGTTVPPTARRCLLEQRVAGAFEVQPFGSKGRLDAVVVPGEAGAGQQAIDQSENAGAFDEGFGSSRRPGA